MNKEERLEVENELLMTCSKAQAINKYIDELEENQQLKERIDKAIKYIECHKYTIKHYEPYGTPTGLPNYETYDIKGYYQLLDILKEEP